MSNWPISDVDFLGTQTDFQTFTRGWAYQVRSGQSSAHYYVEDTKQPPIFGVNGRVKLFQALCGAKAAATHPGPLRNAGKATRCKRCEASARKAGK